MINIPIKKNMINIFVPNQKIGCETLLKKKKTLIAKENHGIGQQIKGLVLSKKEKEKGLVPRENMSFRQLISNSNLNYHRLLCVISIIYVSIPL